jgi:hypothetical protein
LRLAVSTTSSLKSACNDLTITSLVRVETDPARAFEISMTL